MDSKKLARQICKLATKAAVRYPYHVEDVRFILSMPRAAATTSRPTSAIPTLVDTTAHMPVDAGIVAAAARRSILGAFHHHQGAEAKKPSIATALTNYFWISKRLNRILKSAGGGASKSCLSAAAEGIHTDIAHSSATDTFPLWQSYMRAACVTETENRSGPHAESIEMKALESARSPAAFIQEHLKSELTVTNEHVTLKAEGALLEPHCTHNARSGATSTSDAGGASAVEAMIMEDISDEMRPPAVTNARFSVALTLHCNDFQSKVIIVNTYFCVLDCKDSDSGGANALIEISGHLDPFCTYLVLSELITEFDDGVQNVRLPFTTHQGPIAGNHPLSPKAPTAGRPRPSDAPTTLRCTVPISVTNTTGVSAVKGCVYYKICRPGESFLSAPIECIEFSPISLIE